MKQPQTEYPNSSLTCSSPDSLTVHYPSKMGDISPSSAYAANHITPLEPPEKPSSSHSRALGGPAAQTLYNFLLPTIFLNPVLFLHSLNTILTKFLPPIPGHENNIAHPHIDIHASESLCWGYTALMVWAQMAAFLRFDRLRQEQERVRASRGGKQRKRKEDNGYG